MGNKEKDYENYASKILDFERFMMLYFLDNPLHDGKLDESNIPDTDEIEQLSKKRWEVYHEWYTFNPGEYSDGYEAGKKEEKRLYDLVLELEKNIKDLREKLVNEERTKIHQKKEKDFYKYFSKFNLSSYTHAEFKRFVEINKEKVKYYKIQIEKPNYLKVIKQTEKLFKLHNQGKERERGYQTSLRKIQDKIYTIENIDKLEYIFDQIMVVPDELIREEPILKGEIIYIKDSSGKVLPYINPLRHTFTEEYMYNLAGENIYETLIEYEDDEFIDENIKKLERINKYD